MKKVLVGLAVLAVLSGKAHADSPAQTSSPLTTPHKPPLETVLVEGGQPQALVLVPEDTKYGPMARDFVSRFEKLSGVKLPTATEADFATKPSSSKTLVVFGNFATGPVALRLYANKLICSDGRYPGDGGYELRTIPLAMDTGANVLFIGGSSPQSAAQAMDSFFTQVKFAPTIVIPYTIRWVCATRKAPRPVLDPEIEKTVASARNQLMAFHSANQFSEACALTCAAAENYYLSGEDSYGRLYARLADLLSRHYVEKKVDPPTFIIHQIVMALDQVEESRGLTDADRLQAAEWVRQMAEDTLAFWEMRDPIKRYKNHELRPIWNHETHPAIGLAYAAQYLKSHYRLAAADYWEAVVDNLFRGQITCDQPLENSANYQWIVPVHTLGYILATGRLREYFSNGALQNGLEYAIASHDAIGNEATHGDAWSPFGSCAGPLFSMAAAHYRDPHYVWMLNRIAGHSPGLWQYSVKMDEAAPEDHIGLRIFTVHPDRITSYGITGIPPERALDKAVFRSGWDRDAEYMMLGGLNVGNHKHLDANTIIRFSTHRRYWLVDMDYIRAAPKHHNSIAVVRNGVAPDQSPASRQDAQVIGAPPFVAELTCARGSPDGALTQSLLADYGGLDWQRNIFWKPKDFFVVIDRLRARTAGDYIARCFWRTLGEARLEGSVLQVTQKGEHFIGNGFLQVVADDGRNVVEFRDKEAKIVFERPLKRGIYGLDVIAKGLDTSTDSLWVQVDQAEPQAHHLPIGKYASSSGTYKKDSRGPSAAILENGPHRFQITLREGPGVRLDKLVLTPEKGEKIVLKAEDLVRDQIKVVDVPEQHFFIVNADGARLKLRESFDYGHGGRDGYYEKYPFAGKITKNLVQTKVRSMREGEALVFANLLYVGGGETGEARELRQINENAWVVTGASPALIGFGPQKFGDFAVDKGMFLLTENQLITAGAERVLPGPKGPGPAAALALLKKAVQESKPTPAPESAPIVQANEMPKRWQADLQSPVTAIAAGPPGVLCGTEDGALVLLDGKGSEIWRKDLGSRIRTVAFAKFRGGRQVCLVGTHGADAKALEAASGKELWNYVCEPFHGRTGSVATIFPADLNGDGDNEVIVGSDNHHYHALSCEGKLLWRTNTVHASTVGCAGDCDGDKRDEIAAGTEYYWPHILDPLGKPFAKISGGPVTSAVAIFDANGDGKGEAFFGMEDGFVRCVGRDKTVTWKANVGGAPTAIKPLDVNGDGKLEIICASESFSVYALRGDGSQVWRTQLPDCVNDLAVAGDRIAAACDDGRMYLLDKSGTIAKTSALPAPPRSVRCADGTTIMVSAGNSVFALDAGGR